MLSLRANGTPGTALGDAKTTGARNPELTRLAEIKPYAHQLDAVLTG
jgi:hypothetical protein